MAGVTGSSVYIGYIESMTRSGAITMRGNPKDLSGPELKAGDAAPDFSAVDATMKAITLAETAGSVRIFSVVPSLDTPVCDMQTKRFNDAASTLPNVKFYTISMDLPFAMKRWCGAMGVDNLVMISDHRNASFGEAYGTLIPDLRIECRAIFVIDAGNTIRYAEYVREVADHPDYEATLAVARELAGQ
jgi:thiol peroxidase